MEKIMDTDTILVHPVTVLTCADHDPGDEWPGFVREERIAARAPGRHESRARAADPWRPASPHDVPRRGSEGYAIARHYFRDGQEDGDIRTVAPPR